MFETLRTAAAQWNQRTSDRQKLQQSYVVLLLIDILLAGLVSLFNATRSRQLMYVAFALITTLIVNYIVWGLLKTTVLDKLPRQVRATATPRRTNRRR